MAHVIFDRVRAPAAFLIVRSGGSVDREADTVLVQSDWGWSGVARRMGWIPCPCGATDGTVDCDHNTAAGMLAHALDHIEAHAGEDFGDLNDYFTD